MKKVITVLLASGVLFACNDSIMNDDRIAICPSDNSLSARAEKVNLSNFDIKSVDGKFVEIEGILHRGFEDVAIYPSSLSKSEQALWLNFTDYVTSHMPLLEKLGNKEVRVIGKVNASRKGHFAGYMATLDSVFCITEK